MNCAECRENLVACVEGQLAPALARECEAHLSCCVDCRTEYAAIAKLQGQLVESGRTAAGISVVGPVMRQIRHAEREKEREIPMHKLLLRWGLGLGAAAGITTAVLLTMIGTAPQAHGKATQIMSQGAQAMARLTSIHLRGQLRTQPNDNFGAINSDADFVPVEMWKQFSPDVKWRIEKPGRVAVMDGQSTQLFIKPDEAFKIPQASASAFDTQWLHQLANLNQALLDELAAIQAHHWPVTLSAEQGADGKSKSVITVEAKSGLLAGDYLKNKFFSTADTRRVYVFDDQTELLESVKIYLHQDSGDKLVFMLDQIQFNPPFDATVFQLQLPENVAWAGDMQVLPDNQKYVDMTSEQAARAIFEACGREDWSEAAKFFNPLSERLKQHLGGLEVINIGKHFTSAVSLISGAEFVPYEVKLKNGEVKKFNLSLKRDAHTKRWFVDGGI